MTNGLRNSAIALTLLGGVAMLPITASADSIHNNGHFGGTWNRIGPSHNYRHSYRNYGYRNYGYRNYGYRNYGYAAPRYYAPRYYAPAYSYAPYGYGYGYGPGIGIAGRGFSIGIY